MTLISYGPVYRSLPQFALSSSYNDYELHWQSLWAVVTIANDQLFAFPIGKFLSLLKMQDFLIRFSILYCILSIIHSIGEFMNGHVKNSKSPSTISREKSFYHFVKLTRFEIVTKHNKFHCLELQCRLDCLFDCYFYPKIFFFSSSFLWTVSCCTSSFEYFLNMWSHIFHKWHIFRKCVATYFVNVWSYD